MINFLQIFQTFFSILGSKQFLLIAESLAFIVASTTSVILTKKFLRYKEQTHKHQHSFYFLQLVIFGFISENIAWILKLSHNLDIITIDYKIVRLFIIAAWILDLIRYQALGLFIENLIERKLTIRFHQKIVFLINCMFIMLFLQVAVLHYDTIHVPVLAHTLLRMVPIYTTFSIMPSLITALFKLRNNHIPVILKKQSKIFFSYIILPHLCFDFLQAAPFFGPQGALAETAGLVATGSMLFMTGAIIFCAQQIMKFRFLNFFKTVQDQPNIHLTEEFKETIEHLNLATNPNELTYITQMYFKETFKTPIDHICLQIRRFQDPCADATDTYCNITNNTIENFISDKENLHLLLQYKILVADEIAFDSYYTQDENQLKLYDFLTSINSEVFLPIYDHETIIAYLTIKRNNRHKFYSSSKQNRMIIFGTYLASIINIMHNKNMLSLLQESKKIKEELYLKHQEINQYKESLKTILKQKTQTGIGIIFYQNHRFTFGNETAQTILPINFNQQKTHPTTVAILQLAQKVEAFRNTQTQIIYNNNNNKIMVTAVPHINSKHGVILTLHYPDATDIIKTQIDQFHDPSKFDYALYLQTTKSGQLINQIIPSNSESLLNFKINLLELALTKKAMLLKSHHEDLYDIVDIIHSISLRTKLHILDLKPSTTPHDLQTNIFGINPLLDPQAEEPLLKKLDGNGTLFIKNIETLDFETQNKLASFIRYGIFNKVKDEQKISSDVKIICSTQQTPELLLENKKLSPKLYKELQETTINMPSLFTLDDNEIQELIDAFTLQVIEKAEFKNLLKISDKERYKLIDRRPASLQEFKAKIQHMLMIKSKENNIFHEAHFDPELNVNNPELIKAARMGKDSLKDSATMEMLWKKFKSQNKIAQFLGVNRSSVSRRCKEYNLL